MSVVPDHPDIEKLPPEIDGIPVRETIRQLFRDPANGTPDNISKEGCLALALKSNEVGGAGKGYVVWNAWREIFPVTEKSQAVFSGDARDSYLQRFRYQNVTNLSGVDLDSHKLLYLLKNQDFNFRHFKFGQYARFDESSWGSIPFDSAEWGVGCTFFGTKWGTNASFTFCSWGNKTRFDGASWGARTSFWCASWGCSNSFIGASWDDFPVFTFASWEFGADFTDSKIGWEANFSGAFFGRNCLFERVDFQPSICFNSWSIDDVAIDIKKEILKNKKILLPIGLMK